MQEVVAVAGIRTSGGHAWCYAGNEDLAMMLPQQTTSTQLHLQELQMHKNTDMDRDETLR